MTRSGRDMLLVSDVRKRLTDGTSGASVMPDVFVRVRLRRDVATWVKADPADVLAMLGGREGQSIAGFTNDNCGGPVPSIWIGVH